MNLAVPSHVDDGHGTKDLSSISVLPREVHAAQSKGRHISVIPGIPIPTGWYNLERLIKRVDTLIWWTW